MWLVETANGSLIRIERGPIEASWEDHLATRSSGRSKA
jgi:hypothetical protein